MGYHVDGVYSVDIVVPCYNEEAMVMRFYREVKRVLEGSRRHLPRVSWRFLFVDDGSTDKTAKILKGLAASESDVKYISFSRNFGKEAAMYAGFAGSSADFVAVIDADLQHPPSLLPDMLLILLSGQYDCAAARRVTRKGEPVIRSWFARAFYKLMACITKMPPVDGALDFRMMTRQMVDSIVAMHEQDRFSKSLFAWTGYRTHWFEYENRPRACGTTKWSFWKLCQYALTGIISFSLAPLHLLLIVGVLLWLAAFGLAVRCLLAEWSGVTILLTAMLFLSGLIEISLGIVGEYVGRTHMAVKDRPLYIIRESNLEDDIA